MSYIQRNPGDKRGGRPFVKVSLWGWRSGRKVQLDNERAAQGAGRPGLFLSTFTSPNRAWNDRRMKRTSHYYDPAGSRWGLVSALFKNIYIYIHKNRGNEQLKSVKESPFLDWCRGGNEAWWKRAARGWKRDRFTVRFIEASQTASRPRIPPPRSPAVLLFVWGARNNKSFTLTAPGSARETLTCAFTSERSLKMRQTCCRKWPWRKSQSWWLTDAIKRQRRRPNRLRILHVSRVQPPVQPLRLYVRFLFN